MCDYSLELYQSRPARTGEKYVTHRFPSRTVGFVAPGDCQTAVCMAADTKLQLARIPVELRDKFDVGETAQATFVRLDRNAYQHRDAIRFDNGAEVTLQELGAGVTAHIVTAIDAPAERYAETVG